MLAHHDLCFGCGVANLFGLQLDTQADGERTVVGRFFVKQDHQGPRGVAHGGVLAAALLEAMALAENRDPGATRADLVVGELPPVGTFVRVEGRPGRAAAYDEETGREVASATCPRT